MRRQNSVKIAPLRVGYELPVDVSTIHSNSPSFRITVGVKLAFLKALVKHEKYKHLTLLELCEVLSEEEEKEKGEEEESSLIDIFQRLYSSRPHKATGFLYSACFEENASHLLIIHRLLCLQAPISCLYLLTSAPRSGISLHNSSVKWIFEYFLLFPNTDCLLVYCTVHILYNYVCFLYSYLPCGWPYCY